MSAEFKHECDLAMKLRELLKQKRITSLSITYLNANEYFKYILYPFDAILQQGNSPFSLRNKTFCFNKVLFN